MAKCKQRPRAKANALVLNDLDVPLTDEVLAQLAVEDSLAQEFCTLSLNALTGTEAGEALKLRALVKNKVMLILVDSGSSHSFVSAAFLQHCGIQHVPMQPKQVQVANGDTLLTDKQVTNLEWWIQGHTFETNMKVLDLGPFDAILVYDLLKSHSPMGCNWADKTLSFAHQGKDILLQGVKPAELKLQDYLLLNWLNGLLAMILGLLPYCGGIIP